MALNRDDLIEILSIIGCYVQQDIAGTKGMEWATQVSSKVKAELLRLNSGPITLAEAVSSGRSFAEMLSVIPTQWIVRARKARKNAVMYKTFGERPWTSNKGVLYSSKAGVERMVQNGDDALSIAKRYKDGPKLSQHYKMAHLREPSGFVSMSRVADGLRK